MLPKDKLRPRQRQRLTPSPPPGEAQNFHQAISPLLQGSDVDLAAVIEAGRLTPLSLLRAAMEDLARRIPDTAVGHLSAIAALGEEPVSAAAVAALGGIRSAEAAEAVAILAESDHKEVRKEARRALFRLRDAGVTVAARPSEATSGQTSEAEHPVLLSQVSTVDGAGSRLVAIAVGSAMGTATLMVMVVNDDRGVIDGLGGRYSRQVIDTRLRAIYSQLPVATLGDVPADYCRHVLYEAHDLNRSTGHPVPPEYYQWREALGPSAGRRDREPVYDIIDPAVIRWNPQLLAESARLLNLPEFASWVLPEDELNRAALDMSRARTGRLILPGQEYDDPRRGVADRLAEAFFTDPVRLKYKRRLEANASVFAAVGRSFDSRLALAAAIALDPSSHTALSQQPLPIALVSRTMELLQREDLQRRERSGGLLLP